MKDEKDYYLTTAITYTSGKPHIGNTYEIILADAIARFKRQEGYNVRFQTGTDELIKELEIKSSEEVLVLSIITLGKDLKSSTMNLQAPLIINVKNNLAKQFIMQNSEYKTKHPLIRRD